MFFFFNDTATTEIYTLSLHDALPIYRREIHDLVRDLAVLHLAVRRFQEAVLVGARVQGERVDEADVRAFRRLEDRKSTRLNSSHANISYAVFCLKKKNFSPRVLSRTA